MSGRCWSSRSGVYLIRWFLPTTRIITEKIKDRRQSRDITATLIHLEKANIMIRRRAGSRGKALLGQNNPVVVEKSILNTALQTTRAGHAGDYESVDPVPI